MKELQKPIIKTVYQCEICGRENELKQMIEACEKMCTAALCKHEKKYVLEVVNENEVDYYEKDNFYFHITCKCNCETICVTCDFSDLTERERRFAFKYFQKKRGIK